MAFDKEFKEAISRLPAKEKDKLIFRLLKRDLDLANRLYFELISGDTHEDRRNEAKKNIERGINYAKKCTASPYFTPGYLMMEIRNSSGIISDHVKITKDKYGEVALSVFALKEYLQIYCDKFKNYHTGKSYTLNIYLVVKAFKLMGLIKKLHEDYAIDFADDLEKIGLIFGEIPNLMKVATHNGLDVNWLIQNEIPDNIAQIEKDLRQRGYLR